MTERLTPEEIKGGCSEYIDHGGLGTHCRFKPTLKFGGKIYCTCHDPIRLKVRTDKIIAQDAENRKQTEQFRINGNERLRQEGYDKGFKDAEAQLAKQVCPDVEREIRTIILPLCPSKERRERAIARILILCQGTKPIIGRGFAKSMAEIVACPACQGKRAKPVSIDKSM